MQVPTSPVFSCSTPLPATKRAGFECRKLGLWVIQIVLLSSYVGSSIKNFQGHFKNKLILSLLPSLLHLSLFFKFFLGLHLWHMDVTRQGVKSQLQLLPHTTAMAIPDPSCVCELCHSLQQQWIFKPLSKVRNRTYILIDTSWVLNLLSHNGNSSSPSLIPTSSLQKLRALQCSVSKHCPRASFWPS